MVPALGAMSARRRNSRSQSSSPRVTHIASEATAATWSSAGVTCRAAGVGFGGAAASPAPSAGSGVAASSTGPIFGGGASLAPRFASL